MGFRSVVLNELSTGTKLSFFLTYFLTKYDITTYYGFYCRIREASKSITKKQFFFQTISNVGKTDSCSTARRTFTHKCVGLVIRLNKFSTERTTTSSVSHGLDRQELAYGTS
jgi:hypothetical protein